MEDEEGYAGHVLREFNFVSKPFGSQTCFFSAKAPNFSIALVFLLVSRGVSSAWLQEMMNLLWLYHQAQVLQCESCDFLRIPKSVFSNCSSNGVKLCSKLYQLGDAWSLGLESMLCRDHPSQLFNHSYGEKFAQHPTRDAQWLGFFADCVENSAWYVYVCLRCFDLNLSLRCLRSFVPQALHCLRIWQVPP